MATMCEIKFTLMVALVWAVMLVMPFGLKADEEDFEEDHDGIQTEFYLPYSVTEDVDFSFIGPEDNGCYQW